VNATIVTATGSVYRVRRDDDGAWWCAGDNVPTAMSCSLADGEWEIAPPIPWPPVIGERLRLVAPGDMRRTDPLRMPGGGKITSEVTRVDMSGEPQPHRFTEPAV